MLLPCIFLLISVLLKRFAPAAHRSGSRTAGSPVCAFRLPAAAGKPVFMRVRKNPTAVYLAAFEELCQQQKPGFHRFFMVFLGFFLFLGYFSGFGAILRLAIRGKPLSRAAAADIGITAISPTIGVPQQTSKDQRAAFCAFQYPSAKAR